MNTNTVFNKPKKKSNNKTQDHIEDKNDFIQWHEELLECVGEGSALYELDVENWFHKVQTSKKNLRLHIGGVSLSLKLDIDEYKIPINSAAADGIIVKLMGLIPDYFDTNRISLKDLYDSTFPSGIKVSTSISKYLNYIRATQQITKEVNATLSRLGECWSKTKVVKQSLYAHLDTSCKAFVLLGHYGPDNDSCFRHGSGSEWNKITLAEKTNSFVFLLSENNIKDIDKEDNILVRMWGFITGKPNFEVINFCNYYHAPGMLEGNAFDSCRRVSAHLLGVSPDEVICTKNAIEVSNSGVYHNKRTHQPNWSFHKIGTEICEQNM